MLHLGLDAPRNNLGGEFFQHALGCLGTLSLVSGSTSRRCVDIAPRDRRGIPGLHRTLHRAAVLLLQEPCILEMNRVVRGMYNARLRSSGNGWRDLEADAL
ncbi:hypothetical protein LshimejAT787_1002810 [Lyophyllum shimeji]|uniref:Uncharacterized protein n=1 Tax=Lyophyllum shimeji TaxID=47721 RepID=A0A9P3USZ7_LYOSH|nr:hypothetical protein LshimejAT787_1002810 [Lyophyllum shimeji]